MAYELTWSMPAPMLRDFARDAVIWHALAFVFCFGFFGEAGGDEALEAVEDVERGPVRLAS